MKQRMTPMKISSLDGNETRILSLPNNDDGKTKEVRTQRFRIIYRSASSRPIQRLEEATEKSEKRESKDDSALQPIPISHFPGWYLNSNERDIDLQETPRLYGTAHHPVVRTRSAMLLLAPPQRNLSRRRTTQALWSGVLDSVDARP